MQDSGQSFKCNSNRTTTIIESKLSKGKKKGLGLVHHGGKPMVWGKGAKADDFIFLSGAEARDENLDEPLGGIKEQTVVALNRIKQRLEESGTSLENVVKFVWYLSNRSLIEDFYKARDGWLSKNAPKLLEDRSYASTLLIVGLAKENMLVEIDCIAYLPD